MTLGMNYYLKFHSLVLVMVNELLLMLGPVYGITCLMFLTHLTISAHLEKICITFYCHDYCDHKWLLSTFHINNCILYFNLPFLYVLYIINVSFNILGTC